MVDTFTTTTRTGLGSRLGKSIAAVLTGIVMFIASFGVLFWNEGRTDLSSIAVDAVEISSSAVTTDAAMQGSFVSTSGVVTAPELLGDGMFLVPGEYLSLERRVEMFAWVEKKDEKIEKNLGGSETTTTTYTYTQEWTDEPKAESTFAKPEGHENPILGVSADAGTVDSLMVGAYSVAGTVELPTNTALSLTDDMLSLSSGAKRANSEYVFMGTGSVTSPVLGDVRISYQALKPGFEGTVLGKLRNNEIVKYVDEDGNSFFRLFEGTRNEAISTLHSEFVTVTWILRVVGFLMMWLGLASLFGPFSTLLDIVPVFGSLGRGIVMVVTFPIALVLSLVTILVSMVVHSLIAVIIAALLIIAGVVYYLKVKRKAVATAPAKV